MKRLIIGLTAALALAFVGTARADDTKTTEKTTTQKSSEATKDGTAPTTDTGMGGSGASTKTEKKTTTKEEKTKSDDAKATPPAK
jgi:hypothetical protein